MRKLHDRYFRQAKREGHLARSIYKIEEIDRRCRVFRPGMRVLDLGASPGSWLEYLLEAVGSDGTVCAVDIQPIARRFKGKVRFLLRDVRELAPDAFAPEVTAFDAVVSDMAPNTSGVKAADQARSLELCETAAALAETLLVKGGHFVCKIFESPELAPFRRRLAAAYREVRVVKPAASREQSIETYLVALGRGLPPKPKAQANPGGEGSKGKTRRSGTSRKRRGRS